MANVLVIDDDEDITRLLQTQLTEDSSMLVRNPRRAIGGFTRSLTSTMQRNDYTQHAVMALLAALENGLIPDTAGAGRSCFIRSNLPSPAAPSRISWGRGKRPSPSRRSTVGSCAAHLEPLACSESPGAAREPALPHHPVS